MKRRLCTHLLSRLLMLLTFLIFSTASFFPVYAAAPFLEFVDPHPNSSNQFGHSVVPLSTGNVVITSPFDDAGGLDAGAVYLFNGATGALISTLRGTSNSDQIGIDGVTALSNGNYVISSSKWDNGDASNAGAVTWGSGTAGVSGVVSAANSLVGSTDQDALGFDGAEFGTTIKCVTALSNGNYVVSSRNWDNGALSDAGAATWGSGTAGVKGEISAPNSLIGSKAGDYVGRNGVLALSNGNYVVCSPMWGNDVAYKVGAVTWGSGTGGVTGIVSAANSLVGSATEDYIGYNQFSGTVTALSNGNYVVTSMYWDNGAMVNAGAATWCSGTIGAKGVVSVTNSLIGSSGGNLVGNYGVTELSNGNYVVSSPTWSNITAYAAGAVTWGSGITGVKGVVSVANSLIGSAWGNQVGYAGVTALSNGNYVVSSPYWDNDTVQNVGAATWGNGSSGVTGVVSLANSLIGSTDEDQIGFESQSTVTALNNGNYVVSSPNWDNGSAQNAGAVTWGSGTSGVTGSVSEANSLVGSTSESQIGYNESFSLVTALSNGNYVVSSPNWDNGTVQNVGAVTWSSGTIGVTGLVSVANSLIGSTTGDWIGYRVTALRNGNYVVSSRSWDNGAAQNVGAVTWSSGAAGVTGLVSADNSLIGSTAGDQIGNYGVTELNNGNYIVSSSNWDNGAIINAGAVTLRSSNSEVSGTVSAANSVVGSTAEQQFGRGTMIALSNGNYLISNLAWQNGANRVVTWGSSTTDVNGVASAANSLYGPDNFTDPPPVVVDNVNGTFFVRWSSKVWVGSQIDGFASKVYLSSSIFTVTSGTAATTADIAIQRNGVLSGAASCKLTTINGTANTPAQYTAQNNITVNWAVGQSIAHVLIPIAANATTTTAKSFRVVLSAVGGGADLKSPVAATVVILPPSSTTETTKPTVTVAPANNALVNDTATLNITGLAKDNIGVKQVQVSLDGGTTFADAVLAAPGTSSTLYSFPMTPVTGINTIKVKATDFKGNVSTTMTSVFTQLRALTVGIDGPLNSGTVTAGFLPASSRQVGKIYTISATPKTGYVFNGWTVNNTAGTGITAAKQELPALTFTFTEGLVLTAKFIPNPFTPALVGNFNGLVLPDGSTTPGVANVGLLNLLLGTKGSFTGSLKIDGVSLSTPGFFDNAGMARFGTTRATSLILKRTGKPDIELALELDMSGVSGRITGSVTQKLLGVVQAVSNVTADRAHYSTASKVPAALAGTTIKPYTLVFPSKSQTPALGLNTYPQGDGYATMTVNVNGTVSLTGKLADHTPITASAPLSKNNQWPIFAQLYATKGSFAGLATLADADDITEDVSATDLLWFRPFQNVQWYKNGWPAGITVDLFGARYGVPPALPATSVFPGLSSGSPNATLSFADGLLAGSISQDITISTANLIVSTSPTLVITKASGLISGIFTHSDLTKPTYQGVIVQKGGWQGGHGYFMSRATPVTGLGESGKVQVLAK